MNDVHVPNKLQEKRLVDLPGLQKIIADLECQLRIARRNSQYHVSVPVNGYAKMIDDLKSTIRD